MIVTIRDESPGGAVTNELTLDVLDTTITVQELIRSRVYQEVDDYNRRQRQKPTQERFNGLVTPTRTESELNAAAPRREIDWSKQFSKACAAFETNGFFILVDNKQAEELDESIELLHNSTVTFVKLVPLVGG